MKYDHRITGQIIGMLRTQKNLSQTQLAADAGIARSHLAMVENGHKSASVETLWNIATALDMPLSALIEMVEKYGYHHFHSCEFCGNDCSGRP